jgi:transcriptional regulator with XRE-family HTH domain
MPAITILGVQVEEVMSTESERAMFRDRVKKGLAAAGLTQKALEGQVGLKPGTLTRVFGGKKQLDEEILQALAAGLGASPEALVEGTAWTTLVASPSEPEPATRGEDPVPASEVAPEPEPDPEPEVEPDHDTASSASRSAESGPRHATGKKSSLLDYPLRAAVAVAGGAALVGAALFTLLRRR